MNRYAIMAAIAVCISGCFSPPKDPGQHPQAPVLLWEKVLDMNWTMVNDSPRFVAEDEPVGEIVVPRNSALLNVSITQQEKPLYSAFTYGARLYEPDGTRHQETFQMDAVQFLVSDPQHGPWSIAYVTDESFPTGRHALHIVAWAQVESPGSPG